MTEEGAYMDACIVFEKGQYNSKHPAIPYSCGSRRSVYALEKEARYR